MEYPIQILSEKLAQEKLDFDNYKTLAKSTPYPRFKKRYRDWAESAKERVQELKEAIKILKQVKPKTKPTYAKASVDKTKTK